MEDFTEKGGVAEVVRMGNLLKECQDLLAKQQGDIERLTIENKLLRSASEEQRELNGKLRMELRDVWAKYADLNKLVGGE